MCWFHSLHRIQECSGHTNDRLAFTRTDCWPWGTVPCQTVVNSIMQKISERTQGQIFCTKRERGSIGMDSQLPGPDWLGLLLLVMFHCSPIYASLRCPLQRDACSFGQMHGPELPTVRLRKMVWNAIMTWVSFTLHTSCGSKITIQNHYHMSHLPSEYIRITWKYYNNLWNLINGKCIRSNRSQFPIWLRSTLGRTLCSPRCMNSVVSTGIPDESREIRGNQGDSMWLLTMAASDWLDRVELDITWWSPMPGKMPRASIGVSMSSPPLQKKNI